jgi:transcriptional regulator with XRE-family HTH domain
MTKGGERLNTRIQQIRKTAKLTQDEFAEKIGLSKNFVWMIEKGERIPSDRTIKDICRIFGVNEEWLRTGEGDMPIPKSKDEEIAEMLADIQKSDEDSFKHRLVSALAKLDEDGWDKLEELIDMISGK